MRVTNRNYKREFISKVIEYLSAPESLNTNKS